MIAAPHNYKTGACKAAIAAIGPDQFEAKFLKISHGHMFLVTTMMKNPVRSDARFFCLQLFINISVFGTLWL
jgi:hypothetical protein